MPKTKKRKRKKKRKGTAALFSKPLSVIALAAAAILLITGLYALLTRLNISSVKFVSTETQQQLLSDVKRSPVKVEQFYIYGNHLHLEGTVPLDKGADFRRMGLVLRRADGNEKEIMLESEQKNGEIRFASSAYINDGIGLDELSVGNYCILFKMQTEAGTEYLSSVNKTEYDSAVYYTVTGKDGNRRVDVGFAEYDNTTQGISCLAIAVKQVKLPRDVYDVVIDPGHGGDDSGASGFGYTEAQLTLPLARTLKADLEALGLKVKLTRDGTEAADAMVAAAAYRKDGRVARACSSGAKYCLSLHLNSSNNPKDPDLGGVEIYCANGDNTDFAKRMADSIVKRAGTYYSRHTFCRVDDGVYVRTFNEGDLEEAHRMAAEMGYKPYRNQTTRTTYYYMIRELGGIATFAYVDGRSPEFTEAGSDKKSENKYCDSNVGIESYLVELGYIVNEQDVTNIASDGDAYMQALADAFAKELGLG